MTYSEVLCGLSREDNEYSAWKRMQRRRRRPQRFILYFLVFYKPRTWPAETWLFYSGRKQNLVLGVRFGTWG